ncbi:MAG: hypothetical protein AAFO75_13305 [Pseudomonadota bacterium]
MLILIRDACCDATKVQRIATLIAVRVKLTTLSSFYHRGALEMRNLKLIQNAIIIASSASTPLAIPFMENL